MTSFITAYTLHACIHQQLCTKINLYDLIIKSKKEAWVYLIIVDVIKDTVSYFEFCVYYSIKFYVSVYSVLLLRSIRFNQVSCMGKHNLTRYCQWMLCANKYNIICTSESVTITANPDCWICSCTMHLMGLSSW